MGIKFENLTKLKFRKKKRGGGGQTYIHALEGKG